MIEKTAKKGITRKAMWIAVSELLLLIVGFLELLPTAFLAAFVLLVYVSVTSSFTSSSLHQLSLRQKVSRERINEQEELILEETIKNNGTRPVFLEVLTEIPEELAVSEGSNHYITYLRGKETRKIHYKIKPNYVGHYVVQRTAIRTPGFFLSLLDEDQRNLDTVFSVYPIWEELRRFPAGRVNVKPLQGVIPSRSPGTGTEFFEIRDYSPGDELKRINWKASARVGTLLSNEYEREKMADLYIILDSTRSSVHFLKDYIKVCVSIGDYFLRMGNRVGLVAAGKIWTWVKSGGGRRQLVRLVENLIDRRPDDHVMFSIVLEETLRVVPQSSAVIFLSPMRDSGIRALAKSMVERKQKILAIIPTREADYLRTGKSDDPWVTIAKMLARLERENASKFLERIGVDAVEWEPRSRLATTMEAFGRWQGRIRAT
jgi:uncharacterized protein (DUF58 family)